MRLDLLWGNAVANNLAVHVLFTHAASDQLRVLRSEIEDENAFGGCGSQGKELQKRRKLNSALYEFWCTFLASKRGELLGSFKGEIVSLRDPVTPQSSTLNAGDSQFVKLN